MDSFDWLVSRPKFGRGPCLDRMSALLDRVAPSPLPGVKVTGSNGKGSTCAMLSSVLRAHGRRTGLFTSPHLRHVTDRLRIDGEPISDPALLARLRRVGDVADGIAPGAFGTFELLTAAAAAWFGEAGADIAIWEAGIGGRLDATRPLPAAVTALVDVSLEHTGLLGATRDAIAHDKAQLAAPGTTLVVGPTVPRLRLERPTIRARLAWPEDPRPGLLGEHQLDNARCALVSARELLGDRFDRRTALDAIARTALPGRLERFDVNGIEVWLDVAHNVAGLERVAESMRVIAGGRPIVLVIGVSADRPVESMVPVASGVARTAVCTRAKHKGAPVPRVARACPIDHETRPTVKAAVDRAVACADALAGVVFVTGGLFVAAEARAHLTGEDPTALRFL